MPTRPAMTRAGRAPDILECFTRLVAERGIDRANLGDVAAELGISKGTIVHHFGTKDHLVAAQHAAFFRQRLVEAHAIVDGLTDPESQASGLIHAAVLIYQVDRAATLAAHRGFVRVVESDVIGEVRRLRHSYSDIWIGVLNGGMRAGVFERGDPAFITQLCSGSIQWMWTWFDPNGARQTTDVAVETTRLLLRLLLKDPRRARALAAPTARPARLAARVVSATDFAAEPA